MHGWLRPDWRNGVGAVMTTRDGGQSAGCFQSLNLAQHVDDDAAHVAANRALFARTIDARPVYLNQVHGTRVVRLSKADMRAGAPVHEADASITTEPGLACTVLAADCLPVLLAAPDDRAVAAAHAGWRGLSAGVIEAALAALCEATRCNASQVRAWLGASIGPRRFEVGEDVLHAFDPAASPAGFSRAPEKDGRPKWRADLPFLARHRLAACGVRDISGGGHCTFEDAARFFSFRRDGATGRMAAAIWIRDGASTGGKAAGV